MSSTSFGIIWYSLWVFDMLVLWYIHCKITITIGPMCVIIHIRLSSIISDQFTNPIRSLRFRHDVAVSSTAAVDSILPIQRHIGYFFVILWNSISFCFLKLSLDQLHLVSFSSITNDTKRTYCSQRQNSMWLLFFWFIACFFTRCGIVLFWLIHNSIVYKCNVLCCRKW